MSFVVVLAPCKSRLWLSLSARASLRLRVPAQASIWAIQKPGLTAVRSRRVTSLPDSSSATLHAREPCSPSTALRVID